MDFLLENSWLAFALLAVLIAAGLAVMVQLPIEAFPDLTNNQVVVTVQCPGMSPVEVEQLVSYPIETAMRGMPKLQTVRSTSKLELSMVTIIFDDSMDRYLIRQLVAERLSQVQIRLPIGLQPVMNPMSTAFGEVYQYTISAPKMSLMQIKTLQDWVIRYALLAVPGVSEVNSWGGETKQYTIEIDPESLRRYNLSLHEVASAVTNNNANFGGSYIEHAEQQYTIRGIGRAESIDDLGNIVVSTFQGVPILLKQVATIELLPMLRHGAVMKDGRGETVSGMVIILRGANGQKILGEIKQRFAELKLPNAARVIPFYDQSDVINATTATVKKNLFEAACLVVVILLMFLGDWRAAIVVAFTIPLSLLFGFLGMGLFGISVNLMSLGAIDFGTIVDGSVVMVENCIHRLESGERSKSLTEIIREASHDVSRPIIFGVLIIVAVYLPILTLQSLEGRMFRPMAVTVVSALVGSLLLALFAVPALCSLALRHKAALLAKRPSERNGKKKHAPQDQRGWFSQVRNWYERSLRVTSKHTKLILITSGALVVWLLFP